MGRRLLLSLACLSFALGFALHSSASTAFLRTLFLQQPAHCRPRPLGDQDFDAICEGSCELEFFNPGGACTKIRRPEPNLSTTITCECINGTVFPLRECSAVTNVHRERGVHGSCLRRECEIQKAGDPDGVYVCVPQEIVVVIAGEVTRVLRCRCRQAF